MSRATPRRALWASSRGLQIDSIEMLLGTQNILTSCAVPHSPLSVRYQHHLWAPSTISFHFTTTTMFEMLFPLCRFVAIISVIVVVSGWAMLVGRLVGCSIDVSNTRRFTAYKTRHSHWRLNLFNTQQQMRLIRWTSSCHEVWNEMTGRNAKGRKNVWMAIQPVYDDPEEYSTNGI